MSADDGVYAPSYPTDGRLWAFDVDGMLGGLAKWLRILGFDAAFPRSRPSFGRIFITAGAKMSSLPMVRVTALRPEEQLFQVLEELDITPDEDLFLTRCLVCNVEVEPIPKSRAYGKVPERILEARSAFNQCPVCKRIYWEGSHGDRIKERLKRADVTVNTDSLSKK